MKRYIKSTEEIYASSMRRLLSHLDTENVATITAFITSEDERHPTKSKLQTAKQNRAANLDLSQDLNALHYGFSKVDGYYKEQNNNAPVLERSYFVVCPVNVAYENFRKTLIALARKYEQESVLIWSKDEQKAYLYGTTDDIHYTEWATFTTFNIDKAKEEVWSEFKSHHFVFSSDDFVVGSATQLRDGHFDGGPSSMLGAKHWREELLAEYSGEPDDDIVCL